MKGPPIYDQDESAETRDSIDAWRPGNMETKACLTDTE